MWRKKREAVATEPAKKGKKTFNSGFPGGEKEKGELLEPVEKDPEDRSRLTEKREKNGNSPN